MEEVGGGNVDEVLLSHGSAMWAKEKKIVNEF